MAPTLLEIIIIIQLSLTALVFFYLYIYIYIYQEPCWHLRYDMQYERYFFQYAQPGAYDRLGPARPCRCCATPSDSFIMG